MSKTVLFIDSHVADCETLLAGLNSDVEVHLLNPWEDGVLQIAKVLRGYTGLDSIQIVSHGSGGAVSLGAGYLTTDNINRYAGMLEQIGSALSATGDILLYGCEVAQNDAGQNFINQVAQYTKADVAASTDLTGSAAQGGDWELEAVTGEINADIVINKLAQAQYAGILAKPSFNNDQIIQQILTGAFGNTAFRNTYHYDVPGHSFYNIVTALPDYGFDDQEYNGLQVMTLLMAERAVEAFELWDDLIKFDLINYIGTPPKHAGLIQFAYSSTAIPAQRLFSL